MSSYIDTKFINLLSTRLPKFKRKAEYLFNFRCPHCGDSQKSQSKARGFVYKKKNDMFFKCHNCGEGHNLSNFLKYLDPKKYEEYLLERYKGSAPSTSKPKFENFVPKFEEKDFLANLVCVKDLAEDHPVTAYINNRKIPNEYKSKLYLCDKFMSFVNEVKPNTFPHTKGEHPRLIIPFYDVDGKAFAFQGRAFGKEQPKYLTIKLDENKQKVYGLDTINLHEQIYIVEGPIDSMFIDNCLAAGGADLTLTVPVEQVTYIFDNEPRNKEIIKRMYDLIDAGYNVVVWPEDLQLKDVNDLIISGMSKLEVKNLISKHTYSGLEALTNMTKFRKC